MMNSVHRIALIAAIFAFARCEKVIDPGELPDQTPKLVVNGIAAAGSEIYAEASLSRSILSNKPYSTVSGAQLELYENNEFREMLTEQNPGFYLSTIIGKAGANYTLRVKAPGYEMAEAASGIPSPLVIKSVERIDSISSRITRFSFPGAPNSSYSGSVKLRIRLADKTNEMNYYGFKPLVSVFDSAGSVIETLIAHISVPDDAGLGAETTYFEDNGIAFSDSYSINGEMVIEVEVFFSGPTALFPSRQAENYEIRFELFSFSEELYKYNASHYLQRTSGSGFFAEPVLVYSNVVNGLGIFGGVNGSIQTVNTGSIVNQ